MAVSVLADALKRSSSSKHVMRDGNVVFWKLRHATRVVEE